MKELVQLYIATKGIEEVIEIPRFHITNFNLGDIENTRQIKMLQGDGWHYSMCDAYPANSLSLGIQHHLGYKAIQEQIEADGGIDGLLLYYSNEKYEYYYFPKDSIVTFKEEQSKIYNVYPEGTIDTLTITIKTNNQEMNVHDQ